MKPFFCAISYRKKNMATGQAVCHIVTTFESWKNAMPTKRREQFVEKILT
jgi:hypothetical protein